MSTSLREPSDPTTVGRKVLLVRQGKPLIRENEGEHVRVSDKSHGLRLDDDAESPSLGQSSQEALAPYTRGTCKEARRTGIGLGLV